MANLKMGRNVELALDAKATLGEGPMWHARRKKLYWVDILEKKLHEFDPPTGRDRAFNAGQFVGCVAARKKGGLMLGLQHGFAYFNFRTRKVRRLCDPDASRPNNRLNDGKCDPAGRFWAGTMDLDAKADQGSLFCLDTNLRVRRVLRACVKSADMKFGNDQIFDMVIWKTLMNRADGWDGPIPNLPRAFHEGRFILASFPTPLLQHLKPRLPCYRIPQWKATFLKEIREQFVDEVLTFEGGSKYRLIGVPFYNNEDENRFKESLESALSEQEKTV